MNDNVNPLRTQAGTPLAQAENTLAQAENSMAQAENTLAHDVESLETVGGVTIVPVIHFRQEWARLVRGAIEFHRPAAVAVELPGSMAGAMATAVSRLPCLSIAILEYPGGHVRFFPVEPTDPIVEAIRRAGELGIPWKAVDTETPVYPEMDESIPDPYAAYLIGHGEYHSACLDPHFSTFSRIPEDTVRESTMAFHCARLAAEHGRVLLVCGLAHANGVARALAEGAGALPMPSGGIPEAVLATPHPDTIREVFAETPAVMAAWEVARQGAANPSQQEEPETTEADEAEIIEQWFLGQDDELPEDFDPLQYDDLEESQSSREQEPGIFEKVPDDKNPKPGGLGQSRQPLGRGEDPDTLGGLLMNLARKAISALGLTPAEPQTGETNGDPETEGGLSEESDAGAPPRDLPEPEETRKGLRLIKNPAQTDIPDPYSEDPLSLLLRNLLMENLDGIFGLDDLAEEAERQPRPPFPFRKMARYLASECGMVNLDRMKLYFRLIRQAAELLKAEQGEQITPLHLSNLLKFARNYAVIEGLLVPSAWHLAVGCRGVSGDDFAWHFWKLATTYPWHDISSALPIAYIRGEDLWSRGRRFKLERKIRSRSAASRKMGPVKARPRELRAGDWEKKFSSFTTCSYPPEDIVIEGWGDYLKKRSRQIVSAETTSIREFTTSLLDGIDVRETVRNWHQGKIFVRENGRTMGEVGTVVVIFDHAGSESEFPWKATWHGENDQESDMAFYATAPGSDLVGPGIARCRYGGFMLSYPPGRLHDVWRDPVFQSVDGDSLTRPDHLLLAALDYSLEKYVAYVCAKPPSPKLVALGRRMDRRVVYIPMGTFSPVTLRKMRIFHVLAGKEARKFAGNYIFK